VLGLYTPSWCWYGCPEIGTRSIDWAQLNRLYLKTETESNIRKHKQDTNHNICSNGKYIGFDVVNAADFCDMTPV
jgi:hypothetical protein